MQTIHFLGNTRNCFNRHYFPIRAWKNELYESGIKIRFFPSTQIPGIKDCDIIVVFSDGYKAILPIFDGQKTTAIEYLSKFFEQFNKVIWFDDHDSSGMLDSQIFPIVDIYAKAQILKNRRYYLEPHLIGAIHRDYVFEKHGVNDQPQFQGVITENDLAKLCLGWNLSLINWNYYFAPSKTKKIQYLLSPKIFQPETTKINLANRSKQTIFRGRMWEYEPTVGWWREQTFQHIKTFNDQHGFHTPNPRELVSRKAYREEMSHSIICPSPFGKGEICYRDFEAFMTGTILLKPNMSHIQTWPDLYIEGETYISHDWSFNDYYDKVDFCQSNKNVINLYHGFDLFNNIQNKKLDFLLHFSKIMQS